MLKGRTFEITMRGEYVGGPTYIVCVTKISENGIHGKYRLLKDSEWVCSGDDGLFTWGDIYIIEVVNNEKV